MLWKKCCSVKKCCTVKVRGEWIDVVLGATPRTFLYWTTTYQVIKDAQWANGKTGFCPITYTSAFWIKNAVKKNCCSVKKSGSGWFLERNLRSPGRAFDLWEGKNDMVQDDGHRWFKDHKLGPNQWVGNLLNWNTYGVWNFWVDLKKGKHYLITVFGFLIVRQNPSMKLHHFNHGCVFFDPPSVLFLQLEQWRINWVLINLVATNLRAVLSLITPAAFDILFQKQQAEVVAGFFFLCLLTRIWPPGPPNPTSRFHETSSQHIWHEHAVYQVVLSLWWDPPKNGFAPVFQIIRFLFGCWLHDLLPSQVLKLAFDLFQSMNQIDSVFFGHHRPAIVRQCNVWVWVALWTA